MGIKYFDYINELDTERLILREITKDDINEIYTLLSDEEVAKYDWFKPIKSVEEAAKFIEHYKKSLEAQEEITWGVARKGDYKLVGICNLGSFEEDARRAEIGYDIIQSHWNKGYGAEAIKAVVKFGFEYMNLNRIEAFITPGNDASVRVLEKCNFTKEGLVRERNFMKGKLVDGIIMSILYKEFSEQ